MPASLVKEVSPEHVFNTIFTPQKQHHGNPASPRIDGTSAQLAPQFGMQPTTERLETRPTEGGYMTTQEKDRKVCARAVSVSDMDMDSKRELPQIQIFSADKSAASIRSQSVSQDTSRRRKQEIEKCFMRENRLSDQLHLFKADQTKVDTLKHRNSCTGLELRLTQILSNSVNLSCSQSERDVRSELPNLVLPD